MSEEKPENRAEAQSDPKPGPPNPRAEGAEAPTPPGSPMRQDDAGTDHYPGGHDDDVSGGKAANASASEAGGGTIPLEDEQPAPAEDPATGRGDGGDERDALQEENAETSQDQPSQ